MVYPHPAIVHRRRPGFAAGRHLVTEVRSGASATPARWFKVVVRWWLLVGCLLLATSGRALAQDDVAPIRTGTTELSSPAPTLPSEPPVPPGDAPATGHRKLRMPAMPSGYNTHDGGWIRFAYPTETRGRVQPLIAEADAFRAELGRRFAHPVLTHVEVRVARTQAEMASLAPEGAPAPAYASGVAYSELGLVLVTLEPSYPNQRHDLREVFRHELAHVALYDAAGGHHVPRWFNEGFAVHASGEASMVRLQTLWTATLANRLLPLAALDRTFPAEPTVTDVAYAEAADVLRFLVRDRDHGRFVALFERLRSGQDFEVALQNAYGVDRDSLEGEWRADVARRYTFWPVLMSSGLVWLVALMLMAWAWRRRKARARLTLQRWAREEAVEDARRREALLAVEVARAPRLHVVLAESPAPDEAEIAPMVPPGVPKVEHDGRWHTLH